MRGTWILALLESGRGAGLSGLEAIPSKKKKKERDGIIAADVSGPFHFAVKELMAKRSLQLRILFRKIQSQEPQSNLSWQLQHLEALNWNHEVSMEQAVC